VVLIGELGIALHCPHGTWESDCTPVNLREASVVFAAQQIGEGLVEVREQQSCLGSCRSGDSARALAANIFKQKNRCSPDAHSHSGTCMPDHNAAGNMAQAIAERR
jgi:hypothetical protein